MRRLTSQGLFLMSWRFYSLGFFFYVFLSNVHLTGQANQLGYVEYSGNGLGISLNYDVRLSKLPDGLGIRFGVGRLVGFNSSGDNITFPIMLNYMMGKNGDYFEVGAGIVALPDEGTAGTKSLMYRRQPVDGGLVLRIGWTPLLNILGLFRAGVSLGYAF